MEPQQVIFTIREREKSSLVPRIRTQQTQRRENADWAWKKPTYDSLDLQQHHEWITITRNTLCINIPPRYITLVPPWNKFILWYWYCTTNVDYTPPPHISSVLAQRKRSLVNLLQTRPPMVGWLKRPMRVATVSFPRQPARRSLPVNTRRQSEELPLSGMSCTSPETDRTVIRTTRTTLQDNEDNAIWQEGQDISKDMVDGNS